MYLLLHLDPHLGEILSPLVVALPFFLFLPAFVARRTVLDLIAVTVEILAVFSMLDSGMRRGKLLPGAAR